MIAAKRGTALLIPALVLSAVVYSSHAQQVPFIPVTDAVLQNPQPADWLRWRRDNGASGYSPLDQVTRENVRNLRLAWAWAMASGLQQPEPIVYRGVMYLPHTHGVVQALDARTGELIWEYRRNLPEGMGEFITRNLAIYQDKIFLTTEDAYLVALDAGTGRLVWEIETGDPGNRLRYTAGPIAANGRVFAGLSCGTYTLRACFLSAHDAETGEELWRRESVAGPGDPAEHNATWGGVPHEQRRKSSFWLTGSYDPDLNLVYWTTASASPYPELHKGTGSGELLYTNSILALDAESGAIRWFFQMQPRDNFDMDHQDNPILADVEIGGTIRKVVYVLGKPGILWALDRESGEYLWHQQLVAFQNLYEHIDPRTGAITMNEGLIPREIGEAPLVCPGMRGGKLFQTDAYNPTTNALYSPVSNTCSIFEVVALDVIDSGVDYDRIEHMQGSNGQVGRLTAVSAATGELLWTYDQRAALGSVLTTAGGLVFVGDLHRYFRALDADTGSVLWETPLSAPVTGYPISYAADGKQYIAVAVGGTTGGTTHLASLYPELRAPNGSNILMVFALGD
ncbi:MAG: PQQ-binding-like beta-propeller repeat protein [Acidobacteria bacterium]|nr:PQQ-binding-like beta-propeller repeat protein [Acidobacteriota bacterium]